MRKEEKILFRDLTMTEKKNVIKVWERTSINEKTDHAKEKMERLGVTDADVERAWKINHIIEYKVVVENNEVTDVRLLVRGLDVTEKSLSETLATCTNLEVLYLKNITSLTNLDFVKNLTKLKK